MLFNLLQMDLLTMVLGDNIFYGNGLKKSLASSVVRAEKENMASVYGFYVNDPERFGVVEFDENGVPTNIVEKPKEPKSNYAVTGLYFYPKGVSKIAKSIKPSPRGELEITDLNRVYLNNKQLHVEFLGRGCSWLDTGTHESLVDASVFVKTIEDKMGLKVSCPEEIAYKNGWLSKERLIEIGNSMSKNQYGQHLLNVASGKIKY